MPSTSSPNNNDSNSSESNHSSDRGEATSKSFFIRTIIPFLLLQFSVGLCSSLQATFYPIEAASKGATASQFGAVFGIIHFSLFIFGNGSMRCHFDNMDFQVLLLGSISTSGE